MEHLLKFYADARRCGDIGTHVVYHTGTCVRVRGAGGRDAVIAAADAAIVEIPTDSAPVHVGDGFYIVQFVTGGADIHAIVGADSLAGAAAIAKDALRVDREDKKVFAVVWGDGSLDVAT